MSKIIEYWKLENPSTSRIAHRPIFLQYIGHQFHNYSPAKQSHSADSRNESGGGKLISREDIRQIFNDWPHY